MRAVFMLYPTFFISEPNYKPGFTPKDAKHLGSFEIFGTRHPDNEDRLMLCFHRKGEKRPVDVTGSLSLDGSRAEALVEPSGTIKSLMLKDYFFIEGDREIPFQFGEIILRFDGSMLSTFLRPN